jgi:hypothetical protein
LSEYYDASRIFRSPTDYEFDNELARNLPLKGSGSSDFDDDLGEDDLSDAANFPETELEPEIEVISEKTK